MKINLQWNIRYVLNLKIYIFSKLDYNLNAFFIFFISFNSLKKRY